MKRCSTFLRSNVDMLKGAFAMVKHLRLFTSCTQLCITTMIIVSSVGVAIGRFLNGLWYSQLLYSLILYGTGERPFSEVTKGLVKLIISYTILATFSALLQYMALQSAWYSRKVCLKQELNVIFLIFADL